MEAANLPTFRNFGNTKTSDIYVTFAKNHGWPRNWGGPGAKLGVCAPQPGPKTATGYVPQLLYIISNLFTGSLLHTGWIKTWPYRNYSYEWNLRVTHTRMYVNGYHWNTCKLVFAGTCIQILEQCWIYTRVYANTASISTEGLGAWGSPGTKCMFGYFEHCIKVGRLNAYQNPSLGLLPCSSIFGH